MAHQRRADALRLGVERGHADVQRLLVVEHLHAHRMGRRAAAHGLDLVVVLEHRGTLPCGMRQRAVERDAFAGLQAHGLDRLLGGRRRRSGADAGREEGDAQGGRQEKQSHGGGRGSWRRAIVVGGNGVCRAWMFDAKGDRHDHDRTSLGLLGAGIGLLLADKLSDDRRKGIGWTLVAVGVLTTIPLAMMVFGHRRTVSR